VIRRCMPVGVISAPSHAVSHLLHGSGRICWTERHRIARVRTGWMLVGVLPRLRSPVRTRSSAPQTCRSRPFAGCWLRPISLARRHATGVLLAPRRHPNRRRSSAECSLQSTDAPAITAPPRPGSARGVEAIVTASCSAETPSST